MINTAKRRHTAAYWLLPLAMAFLFSLIFSTCNTPLFPEIGSDNAMYLTMGTALAQGYAPYSDIFDHKGPLLFLLQMLPQLFSGGYSMTAVFLQEVLFLYASLLVLAHAAEKMNVGALPVQLFYLAVLAPVMDGGNLTEEYANLFTLIGLDVMTGVFAEGFGGKDAGKLLRPAAVMGVVTMLCFLTRANNMLPLACAVLALAACMACTRRFAHLGVCAGGYALGLAAALAPVAAWLAYHGAIGDAIYGSITHNMMYAETDGFGRLHMLLRNGYGHYAMFIAGCACAGAAAYWFRCRRLPLAAAMVLGAAGAGGAAFISHKYYLHYLMLGVPMAALGAGQALALIRERFPGKLRLSCRALCVLCCAALIAVGVQQSLLHMQRYRETQNMIPDAQALYALVPEEDRDSFMAYRVEPKWYVATGALPSMRFYFLQEILGQADPAVMDEIAGEFENNPPRWVVIFYNREFGPPYDARVDEIFKTRYEFVDAKGQYQLLKLREVDAAS
ncbi:MAG: hypothetical protein IJD94_07070 [Clostridia bacterium]|nr:hypothetical protein [Clostridia bacterium]